MGIGDTEFTLAKVEVPLAAEDSARVVDAVLDLFSPLTETFGTLGDQVRLFRTRSALRAVEEAKRLADRAGVRLNQPPLKFLLPYLEGASKEHPEDAQFQSLWANLLVNASDDADKAHPLLVEVLGKLISRDAIALEKIVRNPRVCRRSVAQIADAAFLFDKWDPVERYVDEIIAALPETKAVDALIDRAEDRGTIVTSCGFYSIGPDGAERDIFEDHPDFPEKDDLSLHALAALGLVRYPVNVVRRHAGGTFIMTLCVLSDLGAEFYLMTHAPEVRSAGADFEPFSATAA